MLRACVGVLLMGCLVGLGCSWLQMEYPLQEDRMHPEDRLAKLASRRLTQASTVQGSEATTPLGTGILPADGLVSFGALIDQEAAITAEMEAQQLHSRHSWSSALSNLQRDVSVASMGRREARPHQHVWLRACLFAFFAWVQMQAPVALEDAIQGGPCDWSEGAIRLSPPPPRLAGCAGWDGYDGRPAG
jgi:hypothetical protein